MVPVAGGAPLVITGAERAWLTVIEKFWVAAGLTPFVAVTVPVNTPAVVGVPNSTPLVPMLSPGGRLPEVTLKVGAGLPVAAKAKL